MSLAEEMRQYEAKRLAIFWSRVTKRGKDECWLWEGEKDRDGYGLFSFHNEVIRAPRFMMQVWLKAKLGETDCVLHRCDNPPCVNPNHLFIGTVQDNNADCVSKGRQAKQKGEKNPASRLSEGRVREILFRLSEGEKAADLAREYKMSKQTISAIKTGERWRHIG